MTQDSTDDAGTDDQIPTTRSYEDDETPKEARGSSPSDIPADADGIEAERQTALRPGRERSREKLRDQD